MKLKLYIAQSKLRDYITKEYGIRCKDYEEGCHCCLIWKQFYDLIDNLKL